MATERGGLARIPALLRATGLGLALACAAPSVAQTRHVGSLTLHACRSEGAYCGTLTRALDPSGRVAGSLEVYFEFYPHRAASASVGTLVAVEGGPGYPSTESREGYLALFEPLRGERDVLLMDSRGTGRSGAIDCKPLQDAPEITETDVGTCGRWLGAAAPLYSTPYAADDLAAILAALGSGPIDLYADSYGTFSAQVFARRHPDALRSVTLDAAYPVAAEDEAWVPSYAPAMRAKFELACARTPSCRSLPGTSLERIAPVLDQLRHHPFAARISDADGRPTRIRADAAALATVMFGAAPAETTIRELDAAARAFVAGDRLPLLRLMVESSQATDSRDPTHDPRLFSRGQSVVAMCQDAEQIYDMTLAPPARRAQRDRLLAERERRQPDLYAPFTFAEYRKLPLDYAFLDECVDWPPPPPEHPPQVLYPADATPPQAPVLVLVGELDNITTPANGAAAAAAFPHGRMVTLHNSLHVNAGTHARSDCGTKLVRRFIADLDPGNTACAETIAPLRLVPAFARRLDELSPATATPGNEAGERALRAAHAAVRSLADVIGRLESSKTSRGPGLRGGTFRARPTESGERVSLRAVRFTTDLTVSGSLDFGGERGSSAAELRLSGPDGLHGRLRIRWSEQGDEPRARIEGEIDGRRLSAETPAP